MLSAVAAFAMIGLTLAVYYPGLSGPFLFDDFSNLSFLAAHGGVRDLDTLALYLSSADTDGLGRPISFLSFLLSDNAWPSDPWLFKYHNLLLHVLIGLLLVWLYLRLARVLHLEGTPAIAVAFIGTGLWLLHPLFVSTVLYVVQRMAMLAALFSVAGVLTYVVGRVWLADGRKTSGVLVMSAAVAVFLPLAVLSKENGILLPLFLLLVEITLLRNLACPISKKAMRSWQAVFLILPLVLLFGYFAVRWEGVVLSGYQARDFSLTERLLTQPRMLVRYFLLLAFPRSQTTGLYNDDISVSTGLFSPLATLPSIVLVLGSIFFAWRTRRRLPVLSLAILFYFGGHLLESTVLPLELYFEHRNYLPSIFLFFAGAYYGMRLADRHRRFAWPIIFGILMTYGALTYSRAALWSDLPTLALVWVEENPDSVRARQQASIILAGYGDLPGALRQLEEAMERHPREAILPIQALALHCQLGTPADAELERAVTEADGLKYTKNIYRSLERLIVLAFQADCDALGPEELYRIIQAWQQEVASTGSLVALQDLYYLEGFVSTWAERREDAHTAFVTALNLAPNVEVAIKMAAVLASHGSYTSALTFLELAERILAKASKADAREKMVGEIRGYGREIPRLRAIVQQDLERAQDRGLDR